MGVQVTITLSDKLYQSVEQVAQLMGKPFDEVLAATLEQDLPVREIAAMPSITSLSDEEVLKLTKLQMEPAQDKRQSFLLQRQQATKLSDAERIELRALMHIYQVGLLRKAQALAEAVSRGIHHNDKFGAMVITIAPFYRIC